MNNMNKNKYMLFRLVLIFFIIFLNCNIIVANDGGEFYWGPRRINSNIEEKYTNFNGKSLKVYKGAGKEFDEFENITIPSDVKVEVYADITDNNNINWSLIKFYFLDGFGRIGLIIGDIPGKTYEETNDEDRIEYYNSLSEKDKYELLACEYGFVNKDYGWVESKYLINKEEINNEDKKINNANDGIKKENENIIDNENIKKSITEETKKKKRSIFDIIKEFFIK